MDSFGLSGFNSPEIIRENQTQNTTETISIPQTIAENETPVIPLVQTKPSTNWLKYAAVIALFSSAGTYGYKMYYDYTIDQKTILVEKSVQEKVNQKLQEATFVLPNPMAAVDLTLEEKPNAKYHVVAGAYRSEQNAEKAMKLLVSQGFEAHLLTKNKYGLIPVAFGSYSNLKEAQNLKLQIKAKDSIDAWLLID